MNEGFIKLPRNITSWRWYPIRMYFAFTFICCLSLILQMPSGGMKQLKKALTKLEETGTVSIKITNKYSIITISKWQETQRNVYFFYRQFANKSPTNHQQITTI